VRARAPTAAHIVFIAIAAHELGEHAKSRAIKPTYVARDRSTMLHAAWQLRQALAPFWS
jgi:hypothetical protein